MLRIKDMKSILMGLICCVVVHFSKAQDGASTGFTQLFDGKTLKGWTPTEENSASFLVENGELVCRGGKAHLFYTGNNGDANFKNFDLKLKVKTTANSNSGVYFHTKYQKEGWPKAGFEAQVNSTHTDPRKTGSLYGVVNVWVPPKDEEPYLAKVDEKGEVFISQPQAPSVDDQWFDYHIKVRDNSIIISVNGVTTVNWTQPEDWKKNRRIGNGTIALQAHDPKSEVHYKNIEIRVAD